MVKFKLKKTFMIKKQKRLIERIYNNEIEIFK